MEVKKNTFMCSR